QRIGDQLISEELWIPKGADTAGPTTPAEKAEFWKRHPDLWNKVQAERRARLRQKNPCDQGVPKSGKLNPPKASDPVLQDAYRNLWRPEDTRPGGTIGELLREYASGGPLKHLEKAKGRLQQLLQRLKDTSNPLSQADRAGAERVINDLKDAIRTAEGR